MTSEVVFAIALVIPAIAIGAGVGAFIAIWGARPRKETPEQWPGRKPDRSNQPDTADIVERMQRAFRQLCPACQRFEAWRADQLCVGGCGKSIGALMKAGTPIVQGWVCQPCTEKETLTPLVSALRQRRLAVVRERAQQLHAEYHSPPTKPPTPPGAA